MPTAGARTQKTTWHRWSYQRVEQNSIDSHPRSHSKSLLHDSSFHGRLSPISPSTNITGLLPSELLQREAQRISFHSALTPARDSIAESSDDEAASISIRIKEAAISLAVTKGDPHGDFSWHVQDPVVTSLPRKLIETKQFAAFECLMTDLRFLIRLLQLLGPIQTLTVYGDAIAAFAAHKRTSRRLEDYRDFISRYMSIQHLDVSLVFRNSLTSKQPYVRQDASATIQQYIQRIKEWNNTVVLRQDIVEGPAQSSQFDLSAIDHALYDTTTYYIKLTNQITYMYEIGLASCLPPEDGERLHELRAKSLTRLEACRSKLLLGGLQAHAGHVRAILGLNPEGACEDHTVVQAHKFLNVTQVWDNSDKEEFVALSVYIPKHTLNVTEKLDAFERSLQSQLSKTAKCSLDQVDIVDILCNKTNASKDMNGVVLVKFAEVVKSLSVTVVSGKDFPLVDATGGDPCVTLKLKPRPATRRKSAHRTNINIQPSKPSLMAKLSQHVLYQTRSRSGALRSPHPKFGDKFDFVLYEDNQDLEVQCYESDKGPKIPFGESKMNVSDIINRCHNSLNEVFEATFPLFKPGTKKPAHTGLPKANGPPRETSITLRFLFSAKGSKHKGNNPRIMAESVMMQACDATSALVSGCIIMGPVFHDVPGSWDVVRLYVSSQHYETAAERKFLERFIFPAIAIKCLDLRVRFMWTDLSEYGTNGVKENVTRRLEAIEQCRIRGIKNETAIEAQFFLALIGDRRGKLVDEMIKHKIEIANRHNNGKYRWVVEAADQGISIQEAEIRGGVLNDSASAEALICIRDSTFTQTQAFLEQVPKQTRLSFIENNPLSRTATASFQRNIVAQCPDSVIQYTPTFVGYSESEGVQLGNLEEFGLIVFNRLWKAIRKHYSTCRKMPPINKYAIEKKRQFSAVQSYIQPLILSTQGSQHDMLSKLAEFTDFLFESRAPIALVCGGHGSGKSSLIAKLVYDLGEVSKNEPVESDNIDVLSFHKILRGMALQQREDRRDRNRRNATTWETGRAFGVSRAPSPAGIAGMGGTYIPDNSSKSATGQDSLDLALSKHLQYLSTHDLFSSDWSFRFRNTKTIFFFKNAAHETADILAYLCSSLLQTQDTEVASWHRLEDLIRNTIERKPGEEHNEQGSPILFILDGLNESERDQMCRIIVSFRGKARLMMTVDSVKIAQSHKSRGSGSRWQDTVIFWNGPLHTSERKAILSGLVDRLGPKRMPASLDKIVARPYSEDPIYLATVCSYLRCCMDLSCTPIPLHKLNNTADDIVIEHVFPMIECLVGRELVLWYLHVIRSEPAGLLMREVEMLLKNCKIAVNIDRVRLLSIAFRPFSDPGQTFSTEKIFLNRAFFQHAIRERYYRTSVSTLIVPMELENRDPQKGKTRPGSSVASVVSKDSDEEQDEGWLFDDDALQPTEEDVEVRSDANTAQRPPLATSSQNELESWFGGVMLLCNRALFDRFCCSGSLASSGEYHRRSKTMDLNELIHLLRFTSIFPNHVSKTEIVKAFQVANKNAQKSWVYDITSHNALTDSAADMHEMGFEEFVDCMRELEILYANRSSAIAAGFGDAAVVIQRRVRGIKARMQAKRAKHEKEYENLQKKQNIRDDEVSQIVKLQALARARKERNKLQQNFKFREAFQQEKARKIEASARWGGPAIKGRRRKNGDLQIIQDKLKVLFNSVQDAFVWFDTDGNERITNVEMEKGFHKLGLESCNMKKICCLVIADGVVDVLEFLRTFSWHDVKNVETAVNEAKMERKVIVSRAMDRMAILQEAGKDNEERVKEQFSMQNNIKVYSDSTHVYKEQLEDDASPFSSWDGKTTII